MVDSTRKEKRERRIEEKIKGVMMWKCDLEGKKRRRG